MTRDEAIRKVRVALERLKSNFGKTAWWTGTGEAFEMLIPELKPDDEATRNEILLYIGSRPDIDLETHNRWCSYLERPGTEEKVEKPKFSVEQEDEKIRKAIIELLKEVEEDETYTGRQHIQEMIAYLEKQNPVECSEEGGKAFDVKDDKWYACTDVLYHDGRAAFSPGDIVLGRSIREIDGSVAAKHFAPVFFPYDDPIKFTEDVVIDALPSKYSDFTRELEYWFGQVLCNYENNGCPDWKMNEYAKEYVGRASEHLIPLAHRISCDAGDRLSEIEEYLRSEGMDGYADFIGGLRSWAGKGKK